MLNGLGIKTNFCSPSANEMSLCVHWNDGILPRTCYILLWQNLSSGCVFPTVISGARNPSFCPSLGLQHSWNHAGALCPRALLCPLPAQRNRIHSGVWCRTDVGCCTNSPPNIEGNSCYWFQQVCLSMRIFDGICIFFCNIQEALEMMKEALWVFLFFLFLVL